MLERSRGAPRALPGTIAQGALLVVDVQGDFANPSILEAMEIPLDARTAVANAVDSMLGLIDAARSSGLPIIWLRQADSVPPWSSILWLNGRDDDDGTGYCVPGTPGFEFWRVAPQPDETIVTKSRYSGFVRTELEDLLVDGGATWVAVCGLTTGCCVSSTACDATAEYDLVMHRAALESMAENVGLIVSAAELARGLAAAPGEPAATTPQRVIGR
jgi:ureidoacrylate peracid hydrolase